jgi:hypothetical protein
MFKPVRLCHLLVGALSVSASAQDGGASCGSWQDTGDNTSSSSVVLLETLQIFVIRSITCLLSQWSAAAHSLRCLACFAVCPAGTFLQVDNTTDQLLICTPCPIGSVMPDWNEAKSCLPCRRGAVASNSTQCCENIYLAMWLTSSCFAVQTPSTV